jgi:hypothetical protein
MAVLYAGLVEVIVCIYLSSNFTLHFWASGIYGGQAERGWRRRGEMAVRSRKAMTAPIDGLDDMDAKPRPSK